MVLSEDIQVNKPNAEFFKEILRRNLNVLPQNILLVDDNEGNILGAEAEGMTAILFETGDSLRKELEKLGVIL
jgi:HAD superfamily hydrolase (TIGR01509 family)